MRKYCRKMKKRRVSFSLFHANDVGNMETLLSKLWAFVVQRCSFSCRPLACGNVSTGQTHQNYSDKNCNISNCKTLIINALDLLMLDIFRIFIV